MKLDRYLKIILTIIALCLIWLSVKDVVIGSNELYGSTQAQQAPRQEATKETKGKYKVVDFEYKKKYQVEPMLNEMAKAGWKLHSFAGDLAIFEH
jgi:hypothetical protein